jgi:hypothetical protein
MLNRPAPPPPEPHHHCNLLMDGKQSCNQKGKSKLHISPMVGESVDKMNGAGEGETGSHGHKDGVASLGIGQHRRTEHFSISGQKFEEVTLGK